MKSPTRNLWGTRVIVVALVIVLIILLGGYAIKGFYSRYYQDDYCYAEKVRNMGFWTAQSYSYFNLSEYNPDRFSLTFFQDLIEVLGGVKFVPYVATIVLMVWILALANVFRYWNELATNKANKLIVFLPALFIVFLCLYVHPIRYQILLWTNGMNTYLMPTIFATIILGCLLKLARSGTFKVLHAIGLGVLSLIAAGFSETGAIWQLAVWAILLFLSWFNRNKSIIAKNAIKPLLVIISSTLVGIIILAICPTNAAWSHLLGLKRPGFGDTILLSLNFGTDFLYDTLKRFPLPTVVITAFGFWFRHISHISFQNEQKIVAILKRIAVIILSCFALSVAVTVPTVMATSSYPWYRAFLPAYYTFVVCIFLIGWEAANLFANLWPKVSGSRFAQIIPIILGLALVAYIARTTPHVFSSLPEYQARAAAWDARQVLILDAKAAGEEHITVPAFDSVGQVTELYPKETFWVNVCAANYYGVKGISAIENYDGVPVQTIKYP